METFIKTSDVNGIPVSKTYTLLTNLRPDPQNPRDIADAKMTDLIDFLNKYDTFKPLLVDARTEKLGQLIGGNKRLEAMQKIGRVDAWVEFRLPGNDAEAFEMATIDNMEFGYYLETQLKSQIREFEADLGDDLEKLTASLKVPDSLNDLLKSRGPAKSKFEIVIRCMDEADLQDKFNKIAQLGISAKTKR